MLTGSVWFDIQALILATKMVIWSGSSPAAVNTATILSELYGVFVPSLFITVGMLTII